MEVQSSERPSGHDGDLTAPHGVTSSPAGKLNFSRDTQAKGQGISVSGLWWMVLKAPSGLVGELEPSSPGAFGDTP